jgi:hypothetical protein
VPVEASEEHRVQLTRRLYISFAEQDVLELVRVLACDVGERKRRKL